MFMQPNSNQTITVTKSDNGRFIIQYYETMPNMISAQPGTTMVNSPMYNMKTIVAVDADEATAIFSEKVRII
jgi:hypothetical protein